MLVINGKLYLGDILLVGREYGRERAMIGDDCKLRESAGPALPVEGLGVSGTPVGGDEAWVVLDERKARNCSFPSR